MLSEQGRLAQTCSAARTVSVRSSIVIALALVLALLPLADVQAQSAGTYRVPAARATGELAGASLAEESYLPPGYVPPGKMIVDTDTGVDDAAALAWLLTQPQVELLGITTVAGNTTVDNATKNVLALLLSAGWTPDSAPAVLKGASKPQNRKLSSTGKLIHGTDGLGFARYAFEESLQGIINLDLLLSAAPKNVTSFYAPRRMIWRHWKKLPAVPKNVVDFYCSHAPTATGAEPITILALGPLTNIAAAIKKCPAAMRSYQYVVLGGDRGLGNQTPSAEYNFWQDPDSAERVFTAGIPQMIVVPTDAFSQFALTLGDAFSLAYLENVPLANLTGGALAWYIGLFSGEDDSLLVSVPDPTAAMVAVYPQIFAPYLANGFGAISAGLVKVNRSPEPEYLRGGATIGIYAYNEPLTMIAKDAELSALYDRLLDGVTTVDQALAKVPEWQAAVYGIYMREGPNAQVVLYPNGEWMRACFLAAFTVPGYADQCPLAAASAAMWAQEPADANTPAIGADDQPDVFLPLLSSD